MDDPLTGSTGQQEPADIEQFARFGADLTPKQQRALVVLLHESTIASAAAVLDVGERTLYTWLTDPVFAEAYRAARWEVLQAAIGRLHQASSTAAETLIEIMNNHKNAPATRSRAATTILEYSMRARELEGIETRLSAIEEALSR